MTDFFNKLNFTSSNEDSASEIAALSAAKRIVCLTGSGGRVLDLLLTNADEIIALDMNRAQNALLALKMAAISQLDYQEYLGFIGVIADDKRLVTLRKMVGLLSQEDRNYWENNQIKVKNGLWYAGLWERILCASAKLLRLFKAKQINALFASVTIDEQAKIWQKNFDQSLLRVMIRLAANRFLWTHILGEPGGAFLPPPKQVAAILAMRFRQAASEFFFNESDFASLIFKGKQKIGVPPLPLHMQETHFNTLRDNLKRIRIVNGRLGALKTTNISEVDGFSLSDFGSYCTDAQYRVCWDSIVRSSVDKGVFCERIFMVDHQLPFAHLFVNEALSAQLSKMDKALIYQIRVGNIVKNHA